MNIYYIVWLQSDKHYFRATVVAKTEAEAINELCIDSSYNRVVTVNLIGLCTSGITTTRILSEEDL